MYFSGYKISGKPICPYAALKRGARRDKNKICIPVIKAMRRIHDNYMLLA